MRYIAKHRGWHNFGIDFADSVFSDESRVCVRETTCELFATRLGYTHLELQPHLEGYPLKYAFVNPSQAYKTITTSAPMPMRLAFKLERHRWKGRRFFVEPTIIDAGHALIMRAA